MGSYGGGCGGGNWVFGSTAAAGGGEGGGWDDLGLRRKEVEDVFSPICYSPGKLWFDDFLP